MLRVLSFLAATALCLTGLSVSVLLHVRAVALLEGRSESAVDLCGALFESGACDSVLADPGTWVLGLPPSGWGVVHFGILLVLILAATPTVHAMRSRRSPAAAQAALLLSCLGALASLVLAAVLGLGEGPACPLCLVVHAASVPLPLLLAWGTGQGLRGVETGAAGLQQWMEGRRTAPEGPLLLLGLLAVGLYVGVRTPATAALEAAPSTDPVVVAEEVERHLLNFVHDIPVRADDPRLGGSVLRDAETPVTVVVFSSFGCPGCADIAPELRRLAEERGEQVRVVFKHFPLDRACNPAIEKEVHPGACDLARAAEAARLQGRFWDMHDALHAAPHAHGDPMAVVLPVAESLGLDVARLRRDMNGAIATTRVQEDAELGDRSGVNATPALFVNGLRVQPLDLRVLDGLVDEALGEGR